MNSPALAAAPLAAQPRLELVDALRGSALLGILLLHSIEHWDFLRDAPPGAPWLEATNRFTHDAGFFLFGGKAYAIFALLFGVSFNLLLEGWARRGIAFERRFLWRLTVLAVFGYLHAVVYCGDILLTIAVLGVPLVWLHRMRTRTLAWIAVLLLLQIPSVWETIRVLRDPVYPTAQPLHWGLYGRLFELFANGSFLDVTRANLGWGQLGRLLWTVETGRYTQMLGLFVCGLLLGRANVFADPERLRRLAWRALLAGVIGFALIHPVQFSLKEWGLAGLRYYTVNNLMSSYANLAQMAVWAGAFVLLWRATPVRAVLRLLAPYGRMSLTCYVTQGLIGVPLFYGWGFALWRKFGAFPSVLIALGIFAVQLLAAHWWLRRFQFGPLEWLWRRMTLGHRAAPLRPAAPMVM